MLDSRPAFSIATNGSDEIYVTHPSRYGVCVYHNSSADHRAMTSSWTESHVSKAFFTKDNAKSTLVANSEFIAGSSDNVKRVFTRKIDCSAWKTFGAAKGEEGDEYETPIICDVDLKGDVLFVNKSSGKLRVMTQTGDVSTLSLTPPCAKPISACVIHDDLYVLQDQKTVTVAKFIQSKF